MTTVLPTVDSCPYLLVGDRRWSSADVLAAVLGRVAMFASAGVRSGDRVVVKGGNSAAYVTTLIALVHLDTSLVLVDHQQTEAETADIVTRTGAQWVLHAAGTPVGDPGVRSLTYDGSELPRPAPGPVTLDAWRARTDAVVLWSSGTTGPAKGIVKSGRAVLDNCDRTAQVMGYRSDDVMAPWLPFSHQYGLSLVLLWWLTGCGLLISDYHRTVRAVADLGGHGATVVDATPSTYFGLLALVSRRPDIAASLQGVRLWGVGGAPLPATLAAAFRDTVGADLLDGYGATELGNVALATPDNPVGCGHPLPGVEVRVVDPAGEAVPAGEPGEVRVRSAGLMGGYLGPGGSVLPVPPGWYDTQDLGFLDRDGNLHVLGRREAVHRNGYTLYPASIERRGEQAGRPVKVVALDDERRGSLLAFVVADPDLGDPADWRRRLCAVLSTYERPNSVHVLPQFPVNANGKIDVPALRALVEENRPRR